MSGMGKWSVDGMALVTYNRLRRLFRLPEWDDLSEAQRRRLVINAVDIYNEGAKNRVTVKRPKVV